MSVETIEIPWNEGKVRRLTCTVAIDQGQLVGAAGILATKGDTDADSGVKAYYVAGASIASANELGVYQNCVIKNASIALGTAGDVLYNGTDGAVTRVAPLVGDSDISQPIGVIISTPVGLAGQINLENTTATVLS